LTSSHQNTRRPQLVYLVFGADTYHQEAVFSIASALANMRDMPEHALDIQVFTDNAEPYLNLPVRVRPLDAATRKTWSEPHGYHFRIKHVALRTVLQESDCALLIDTDTFFQRPPLELFARIEPGTPLCNSFNPPYGAFKDSDLYQGLAPLLFERGLADDQMPLINSGVIGLMQEDVGLLDKSIALMDELFPMARGAYILEEFCLGVAAYRNMTVRECPDLIHHYWSRKQLFRAKIRAWLNKHGADPISKAALDDTLRVSAHLPRPPAWQRLMYKALTLGVPLDQRQFIREILYGCYQHPNEFDRACSPVWWEKAYDNAEQRQARPIAAHQLEGWLNHWAVRGILGSRREAIFQHLLQHQTGK